MSVKYEHKGSARVAAAATGHKVIITATFAEQMRRKLYKEKSN